MNEPNRNPASIRLSTDPTGHIVLVAEDGSRVTDVRPLRLFPLSDPLRWIVLLNSHSEEVAFVEDPTRLDDTSRELLLAELGKREFVPQILRIVSVSGNSEPCRWEVETDRGPTAFVLNHENDIRRLSSNSVLVVDAHGIRYLVPDDRNLDAASRRVIEWYV